MALTLTPDLIEISDCDQTTGWSTGTLSTDFSVEGTASLGVKVSAGNSGNIIYTIPTAIDMSNGEHIFQWMMVTTKPDDDDGYQMYVADSSGNWGLWYVGGGNTAIGWTCFVVDPSTSPDEGSGTIDTSDIKYVGVKFIHTIKITGQTPNCYWDIVRYGKGLVCTSGATDAVDMEEIYQADLAGSYGVISKRSGVYYVQGKLTFGDDTSTGSIDFSDSSQVLIFPDNAYVADDLYEIIITGNSTGTTNFQLGSKSGSSGISGCVIKSAGTKRYTITADDTNIDKLLIYGTSFIGVDSMALPVDATNREVLNCNFEASGPVDASTCVVESCNFIDADTSGVVVGSTSFQVSSCAFIGCPDGIEITVAGTYAFDDMVFSGCTYDVENSSTGAVIVGNSGTSNASTYENTGGGSTTINTFKTLLVSCKNEAGTDVESVNVRIETDPAGVLVAEGSTDSAGEYEYTTYNYTVNQDVKVIARKKGKKNNQAFGTITTVGLSVPFTMVTDRSINLP